MEKGIVLLIVEDATPEVQALSLAKEALSRLYLFQIRMGTSYIAGKY